VFGFVSPHLDDVALSCSRLVAMQPGSVVVTAFAGGPPAVDPLPDWDRTCGFEAGDDVTAARRGEDAAACSLLGATFEHLGHWDEQYRRAELGYAGPAGDDLVEALAADLAGVFARSPADAWVVPLGIHHTDHLTTARACLAAIGRLAGRAGADDREWYVYQELPYHLAFPESVATGIGRAHAAGFQVEVAEPDLSADGDLKRAAIDCHRSQVATGLAIRAEHVEAAVAGPESYLRLRRVDPKLPG